MWKAVKLGDVCDFQNGFAFKSKLFKETGNPILRISNIQNEKIDTRKIVYFNPNDYNTDFTQYEVKPNDLLIAMSGATTGKIGFNKTGATYYLNQRVGNLKPKPTLDKVFLYYLLSTKVQENLNISKGAAQPNLSSEQIKNITFSLPPLITQQRIVAKLDAAFAEIDRAVEVTNNSLNVLGQFREEFISKTFSNTNTNWLTGSVSDFCSIKSGSTVDKKLEVEAGDIAYLKVADMNTSENQNSIVTSSRFLKASDVRQTQIIEAGSIIFPKRGGAILTNKKRITDVPICADLNIMSVKSNGSVQPKLLFYYFLNVDMRKLGSGSSIPQINNYDIEPLKISFPKDSAEQSAIISKLDNISKTIMGLTKIYESKIVELSSLKSSILAQELQSGVA